MRTVAALFLILLSADDNKTERPQELVFRPDVFLHSIPVVQKGDVLKKKSPRLFLEVPSVRGTEFGEVTARQSGVRVKEGLVSAGSLAYPVSPDKVSEQYRQSSFVVDFSAPVFKSIALVVEKRFGPKPTVEQLVRYADEHIEKKTLNRGFDVASRVAATQEGDCTEHAVLLTALARMYGFAARVVHGLVLARVKGVIGAFGHAWAEIHRDGQWRAADAALRLTAQEKKEISILAYVPITVQRNESPAFTREFLMSVSVLHVKGVRVE